jgi:transcription termination factor Rho
MSVDLTALRSQKITLLVDTARRLGLDNAASLRKQDLVFEIVRRQPSSLSARGSGILEILPDGFGFLRSPDANFLPGSDDIYVSPSQIRRFNLRTGDQVTGRVRAPKEGERYFALIKIEKVNNRSPDIERDKILFDNLTAIRPFRSLQLLDSPIGRLLGGYVPLAFGQRVLVVADSRSGRTNLLADIATSVARQHTCILLLIDERPEEVTALQRSLPVEVFSSALDEPPSRHVQVADMALERAKRLVEQGRDVVLLVDSMTRLTRAILSADERQSPAQMAAYRARRFFASGRQFEEGGSLTLIATALRNPDPTLSDLAGELRDASNVVVQLVAKPWLDDFPEGVPGLHLSESFARQPRHYLGSDQLAQVRRARKALTGDPQVDLHAALSLVQSEIDSGPE